MQQAALDRSTGPASVDPQGELSTRLTRLMGLRLLVWTLLLGLVAFVYLRGETGGFSSLVAFATVAASFALTGFYAAAMRTGRGLRRVAHAQLVTDQLAWTAIVYVTGGVTSGGVSFYGLTCLTGAIVLGVRGGIISFSAAMVSYGALALGLGTGLLPSPPDQPKDAYHVTWAEAGYPMLANSVGLGLVTALSSYLAERLRVAGGSLVEAENRADAAERLAAFGRIALGLAHEIRNPLGSIAGSVELLRASPGLGEEDRHLCDIVQRETSRLNDLVSDMLDLSRPRPPQRADVELVGVANDVVTLAVTSGRGVDVHVQLDAPSALHIEADAGQMRQVLWNLVRNAIQVSSAGDVVSVLIEENGDGSVRMSVADQGSGIPPEARDHLFDAMFTTRTHGTGIGLAVVKRIVDAHGFSIDVDSREGIGATFTVTIPEARRSSGVGPAPVAAEHERNG